MELVRVSFTALGAVIGLFVGGALGSMLFTPTQIDVLPTAAGALIGALLLGWLGLRLTSRFGKSSQTT